MSTRAVPTVLSVDDDDSIRQITEVALEMVAGWQVISADGGVRGVELAREHRPDVILLDLMMPDMDGVATVGALRADPVTQDIPVILVTAKAQVGTSQVWDDLPISGVIAKPFNPMTLHEQIRSLLGWT